MGVISIGDIMLTGTVKSYSNQNAFGFIEQDNGNKELFFFKTGLLDHHIIEAGQRVEYVIVEGQKGPQAAKISYLD